MAPIEGCFEEETAEQFKLYRADLRRQFGRNCVGYITALLLLFVVSSILPWTLCGAAFWTVMLLVEARSVFGASETVESFGFRRWQSRQAWVAAADGDQRSLKRLQNVQ